MSVPWIAANWKMNGDSQWIQAWLDIFLSGLSEGQASDAARVTLFAPFVYLPLLRDLLKGHGVQHGAQNLSDADQGARTGEISAAMLADCGCREVLVGHSERRQIYAEKDEQIARKMSAALVYNLRPVLCVGETRQERLLGPDAAARRICQQLEGSLGHLQSPPQGLGLAYEPVWAIGTGKAATPEDASRAHRVIRRWLAERFGATFAMGVPILYGGSVSPENVADLLAVPDVNGVLVGGSSLRAREFWQICEKAVGHSAA